jgi:hypothetical protein
MDRRLQRNLAEKPSHRDECRRQVESMEEEERKKRYQATQKNFYIYKDRLDRLPSKLYGIKDTFEKRHTEASQLQGITDKLFNRFVTIIPIKRNFIHLIVTARIAEKRLYDAIPPQRIGQINDAFPSLTKPGELSKNAVSIYLKTQNLNPSDFKEILEVLGKVDSSLSSEAVSASLRNKVIEELSLTKVIKAQDRVFSCMHDTNHTICEELDKMGSSYGGLDRFFRKAAEFYFETDDITGRERSISPIYKIQGLHDYKKISPKMSKEEFISIKESNWNKFNENSRIINEKVFDTINILNRIDQTFKK